MPSKGTLSKILQKCDSRCKKHDDERVTPRVYKACKRRLDLEAMEAASTAALRLNMKPPPKSESQLVEPAYVPVGPAGPATIMAPVMAAAATTSGGDPMDWELNMDNPWDDVTMPTLGEPPELDGINESTTHWGDVDNAGADFTAGIAGGSFSGSSDDSNDDTTPFGSPHLFDPSPSIHSIEDDSELFPPSDFELEPEPQTSTSDVRMEHDGNEVDPQGENAKDKPTLPDALRLIQEMVTYFTSDGRLTVSMAETILKSFNYILENDLMGVKDPHTNTGAAPRLPLTLDALRRQAGLTANGLRTYAMCPKSDCQALRDMATMDLVIRRRRQMPAIRYIPTLKYTTCDIQQQLKEILARDEIQKAMATHHEHLHRPDRPADLLEDIQHGKTWSNFKDKDGGLFFSQDPQAPSKNIEFILMLDWFKPNAMQRETQSACVISLCIANLPPELRGRPKNKILVGVIPGPHESNVDTIHNFLEPLVDQLLQLWRTGVSLDGEDFVRYGALVLSACDAPAARKVGGTPGHSAMFPCTACWCPKTEMHLFDQDKLEGHDHRLRAEQVKAAKAYRLLKTENQCKNFVHNRYAEAKPSGYRYSALLRLPYWDNAMMTVVDLMHCLFLGLVDWQFQKIWVDMKHLREKHEIPKLQDMVKNTSLPRHCGRPPHKVGASAGGNLTSDQLQSLITIHFPLAIPVLWDKVNPKSKHQQEHEGWAKIQALKQKHKVEEKKGDKATRQAAKRHETELQEATSEQPKKQRRTCQRMARARHEVVSDSDSEQPSPAFQPDELHESDAELQNHFSWRQKDAFGILLLASAIKSLCHRTVTLDQIKQGENELLQYLRQCTELQGSEHIQPNHHFATHIAEQMQHYGPMHQFWTYSGECLNFILKSVNNNGHRGGEREHTYVTMFRLSQASYNRMLDIALNPNHQSANWATWILGTQPDLRRTASTEQFMGSNGVTLPTNYHQILMNGGWTFSILSQGSRVVKAQVLEDGMWVEQVGELTQLWEHKQPSNLDTIPNPIVTVFAQIHWYKQVPFLNNHATWLWYEKFLHLDIDIHPANEFLAPEVVIPVSDIVCHCAWMETMIDDTPVWLLIGLERE
ncbi:Transposase family tnp2 protein [Ceratobasidium theobromae]|uniref:Transposase family tnp2 protein n=1 Tax=Ceratobasidium theobromae TaxID=1582974 RepID=A0A5N5Q907_9AGAM|nr:Transposase family tnp2 protein [Ceratobasidium theobromae]